MSSHVVVHQMRQTRTITTSGGTSSGWMLINMGFLKTMPGLLKLLQIILCCIILGIVGHYITYLSRYDTHLFVPELYLMMISCSCLITTTLLFFSSFCSITTAAWLPKSMFETMYHIVATILFLAGGIALIVTIQKNDYYVNNKELKITAGSLAIVNGIIYLITAVYSTMTFRRG